MNKRILYLFLVALLSWVDVYAAQPKFTIIPQGPTTTTLPSNQFFQVIYTVTNKTKITRSLTLVPIPGVQLNTTLPNACSPVFTLAQNQFCFLIMQINGAQIPAKGLHVLPKVCKTQGPGSNQPDPFLCSETSLQNGLHISSGNQQIVRRVALGTVYNDPNTTFPVYYTSTNGGSTWSNPQQFTPPLGVDSIVLLGVSCDASGLYCAAAGHSLTASVQSPLAYYSTNGGNSWSLATLPSPALPPGGTSGTLQGIYCGQTGTRCTAVGIYRIPGIRPLGYVSNDRGQTWSLSDPIPVINTSNILARVACDSTATNCVTVGRRSNGGIFEPLSYVSSNGGQTWVSSATEPPANPDASFSQLSGVSCSANGLLCTTVGLTSLTLNGNGIPLNYVSSDGGNNWSVSSSPVQVPGVEQAALNAVDCASSGMLCISVGYSWPDGQNEIIYNMSSRSTDGGNVWSNPIFPPALTIEDNTLNSVFCDTAGLNCVSSGSGLDASQNIKGYVYTTTDGGSTWVGPIVLPGLAGYANSNIGIISGAR